MAESGLKARYLILNIFLISKTLTIFQAPFDNLRDLACSHKIPTGWS